MGHLSEFQERANRAFEGTSWHPEKRGESMIKGYESELTSDLSEISEAHHEEYISRFKAKVSEIISARSGIMSAMIVGPARFPTANNQAKSSRYERIATEFEEWREYTVKKYKKQDHDALPQDVKDDEELSKIKNHLTRVAGTIHEINNGQVRGYSKALFVSSAYNKIETLAKNGKAGQVKKVFEFLKELQEKGYPIFTDRHKVWKLAELAEAKEQKEEARAGKESKEFEFNGHTVIINYAEDRLQIMYPGKPDYLTIKTLKSNGFKWSPSASVWQRQLTRNAIYGYGYVNGWKYDGNEEINGFLDRLFKEL